MPVGAPYGRSQRRLYTNVSQCIGDIEEGLRVLVGPHIPIRISRVINGLDATTMTPASGHIELPQLRMKPASNSIPYA